MKCNHRAPNVTITLLLEDAAGNEYERDVLCEYYIDPEDRSVGIFGDEFILEDCFWADTEESIPDSILEIHKEDMTDKAREAWEAETDEP